MEIDMTSPTDVLGSVEEAVLRKPWRSVPVRTYDGKRMYKISGQIIFASFLTFVPRRTGGLTERETKRGR